MRRDCRHTTQEGLAIERATFEQLDKLAERVSSLLGKPAEIDRGGGSNGTYLRVDGHKVVGGTKQECFRRVHDFIAGIEAVTAAAREGKAQYVTAKG